MTDRMQDLLAACIFALPVLDDIEATYRACGMDETSEFLADIQTAAIGLRAAIQKQTGCAS